MPHLRWTGPDSPALLVAPVFFSLWFFTLRGSPIWPSGPPWQGFLAALAATVVITALCLLTRFLPRRPALPVRLVFLAWLALWLAEVVWMPSQYFRHQIPQLELWMPLLTAAVLAFLFVTALAGRRGSAELGRFSLKLGVAFLLAALIRVHDGWHAIPGGLPPSSDASAFCKAGWFIEGHLWDLGPLVLLAGTLVPPHRTRRLAYLGVAVPLAVALTALGVLATATLRSRFYSPSLTPDLLESLLGRVAPRVFSGLFLLLAVSNFGAIRFGAVTAAGLLPERHRARWLIVFCAPVVGLSFIAPWDLDCIRRPLAILLAVAFASCCLHAILKKPPCEPVSPSS